MSFRNFPIVLIPSVALLTIASFPAQAIAYIGPGAGFALVSSFFILIIAVILAIFTLLTLPIRTIFLFFRRRKTRKRMKTKRIIVLGFDGLDPDLCNKYITDGKLPHLAKLAQDGCFKPLRTTTPAISPVAWSTFSTGVNPGKHRIFDFFTRNPKNYLPVLSSALINTRKIVSTLGPLKFPRHKTTVKLLRKSTSFWKILGNHKIFSTILRVPITFPPEKFYGTCLSAMCAPDLRGTQGSFTFFSSEETGESYNSKGSIIQFDINDNKFSTEILGPSLKPGEGNDLKIKLNGTRDIENKIVTLIIEDQTIYLPEGIYSPWTRLSFKAGFRKKISGIARFLVTEISPDLKLYMTPINIDPENPTLPITHPFYYSICLAKLHGPYSTLGLSEDTWALNEGVINEQDFLNQTYDIYDERKKAFLDNIQKSKEGLIVSVFDTTDRIQHMFFRYLDESHPANDGKDKVLHKNAISDVYEKSDQLVGEVLHVISPDDLLLVISDHGFKSFQWGVNLNTWLFNEGYLVLKDGATPGKEWFMDVDWGKTRAYGFGLAGIFINTKGREKNGLVKPGKEKSALLLELKEKLSQLLPNKGETKPINRVILAQEELKGPYAKEAPDIFIGYSEGYRVSWNSAIGKITDEIIEPNTKRWSGDHCLDPDLVPGVLFSNWDIEEDDPALMDLAPTLLEAFGVKKQKFQDGRNLTINRPLN